MMAKAAGLFLIYIQFLPPSNNLPVSRLFTVDRFKNVFFICSWCFWKMN